MDIHYHVKYSKTSGDYLGNMDLMAGSYFAYVKQIWASFLPSPQVRLDFTVMLLTLDALGKYKSQSLKEKLACTCWEDGRICWRFWMPCVILSLHVATIWGEVLQVQPAWHHSIPSADVRMCYDNELHHQCLQCLPIAFLHMSFCNLLFFFQLLLSYWLHKSKLNIFKS